VKYGAIVSTDAKKNITSYVNEKGSELYSHMRRCMSLLRTSKAMSDLTRDDIANGLAEFNITLDNLSATTSDVKQEFYFWLKRCSAVQSAWSALVRAGKTVRDEASGKPLFPSVDVVTEYNEAKRKSLEDAGVIPASDPARRRLAGVNTSPELEAIAELGDLIDQEEVKKMGDAGVKSDEGSEITGVAESRMDIVSDQSFKGKTRMESGSRLRMSDSTRLCMQPEIEDVDEEAEKNDLAPSADLAGAIDVSSGKGAEIESDSLSTERGGGVLLGEKGKLRMTPSVRMKLCAKMPMHPKCRSRIGSFVDKTNATSVAAAKEKAAILRAVAPSLLPRKRLLFYGPLPKKVCPSAL